MCACVCVYVLVGMHPCVCVCVVHVLASMCMHAWMSALSVYANMCVCVYKCCCSFLDKNNTLLHILHNSLHGKCTNNGPDIT